MILVSTDIVVSILATQTHGSNGDIHQRSVVSIVQHLRGRVRPGRSCHQLIQHVKGVGPGSSLSLLYRRRRRFHGRIGSGRSSHGRSR